MILKIVFYILLFFAFPWIALFQNILFTLTVNFFVNNSKKIELFSFEKKWDGKYIFLMSFISLFIYLGINELWEYFIGQSIPYILILFLLVYTWYGYKNVKEKDLEEFVKVYSETQNSDLLVGLRNIMKNAGIEDSSLSKKEIEHLYIPMDRLVYQYKGIMYSLILLLIYLLVYSKFPSSIF